MKKNLITLILAGAMILSVTACGAKETAKDSKSADNGSEENVQIANPFTDYNTLEEAEAAAGFDISAPDSIDGKSITLYEVMDSGDGEIFIQIFYGDAASEDAYIIRKAVNSDSESLGGYNSDTATTETADIDGNSVLFTEENDTIYSATWDAGDYAYAVISDAGSTTEILGEIVPQVE